MAPLADLNNEISNEEEMDTPIDVKMINTLPVLKIIKDSQSQHGMRHGDYQRYRQYCSRRMARIRKSLHFPQGTKHKVVPKKVTEENLTDVRFLYLLLIEAERAWAYAMQLRSEANSEPRKRFHMITRLKKSVCLSITLFKLVNDSQKCDSLTKLETKAYSSWMKANLAFELSQWKVAIDLYNESKLIYEKISREESDCYHQRVKEIDPSLRYCAYNIGDNNAIDQLVQMKANDNDSNSNINELILKTREKLASTMVETTWRERCIPVRNEKVRMLLIAMKNHETDIKKSDNDEKTIAIYDVLLKDVIEAQNSLKDELIKEDVTVKPQLQSGNDETTETVSNGVYLYTYVLYLRLTSTAERNLLLCKHLINVKKLAKPQDVARLYDIICQNYNELLGMQAIRMDEDLALCLANKISVYTSLRCYYMAITHSYNNRWRESLALFNRTKDYIVVARDSLSKNKSSKVAKELMQELDTLKKDLESSGYSVHAQSILSSESNEGIIAEPSKAILELPLIERTDYYSQRSLKKSAIVSMPPAFQIIPSKPLFFDVAQSLITLPTGVKDKLPKNKKKTDATAAGESSGISGMMKGLLGWN